jgi:hypothetical protein
MIIKNLAAISIISGLLVSCSLFSQKPSAPVACDPISQLGHDWFLLMNSQGFEKPISRGVLNIYEGNKSLSTLKIKRLDTDFERRIFGTMGANDQQIQAKKTLNDVVLILLPPKVAGEHFNQFHRQRGRNPEFLEAPIFAAIPKEAFYQGVCREGAASFIISSIENKDSRAPANFNISRNDLYSLVSGLYMDPRSSDVEYLRSLIINTSLVDQNTWGGWVDVDVDFHKRTFLHWLFRWPEGQEAKLDGIQVLSGTTSSPEINEIVDEHIRLSGGWIDIISDYFQSTHDLNLDIDTFSQKIKDGTVTAAEYRDLGVVIFNKLKAIDNKISGYELSMKAERGLFIADIERDLYIETMSNYLDESKRRFNDIARAYRQAMQIGTGRQFDIDFLLAGSVSVVNGEPQTPSKPYEMDLGGGRHGVSPSLSATAYIVELEDGQYSVRVNGLSNLSEVIAAGSGVLRREIRNIESCSKKVRFINLDIPDRLRGESYEKPVDIGLQARSCWSLNIYEPCGLFKFCKKRVSGWTKLYDTTARGYVYASPIRVGSDFKLSYGYHACVHGFICPRDNWETELILGSLGSSDNYGDLVSKYGLSVDQLAMGYDKRNDKYLAVQFMSKSLSADDAIDLLTLIKVKIEQEK